MASVELASIANGDLQVAAEDGRVVLKGPSFYFSLSDKELKSLCDGLMSGAIAVSLQKMEIAINQRLHTQGKRGGGC